MKSEPGDGLVFFGATGDLAFKKIFPALHAMAKRGTLTWPVVGVARSGWTRDQFIAHAKDSFQQHGQPDEAAFAALASKLRYVDGDYNEAATFPPAFPMSQIAFYAGWYDQQVSGPFTRQTVEFMPGAFAYHLYSFSAQTLRSSNASWVASFVQKGATCTMGSVDEPYLGGTPNIFFFIGNFLLAGTTCKQAPNQANGEVETISNGVVYNTLKGTSFDPNGGYYYGRITFNF